MDGYRCAGSICKAFFSFNVKNTTDYLMNAVPALGIKKPT